MPFLFRRAAVASAAACCTVAAAQQAVPPASTGSDAPALIDLYRAAVATNPALLARRSAVERAEARADIAGSRLKPQLSISVNAARNAFRNKDGLRDYYNTDRESINLRQPLIDIASSRFAESEALRIKQAQLEHEAVRAELAAEIVSLQLDALNAAEELSAIQSEQPAVSGQRDRLRMMVQRQMAKAPDLLEAEARLATLAVREIEMSNEVQVVLEKLKQATGVQVGAVQRLASGPLPQPPGDLDDWLRRAVESSPELAAAQRGLEAERRAVESVRAQRLPQLALTATQTRADNDTDNRRSTPYTVRYAGIVLSVPLYEGGRVEAGVRDALAREGLARAQLEERRREVELQVRTAWLGVRSHLQRTDAMLQSVQAQERVRDAQQRGFDLGVVTIVDLLQAQQRLFRARADHGRSRHEYLRSLAQLRRHAAALAEDEVERLSSLFAGR